MVDTEDLKSSPLIAGAGSTPVPSILYLIGYDLFSYIQLVAHFTNAPKMLQFKNNLTI